MDNNFDLYGIADDLEDLLDAQPDEDVEQDDPWLLSADFDD